MKINCKESAVRTSELRDKSLKGLRKVELWYHIAMCKFCRIYNSQIKKLGGIARLIGDPSCGLPDGAEESSHVKLSDTAKSRIKENLKS